MLQYAMLGPLMLLTALLGLATAQCPLSLEPAELVQELGEVAYVNCTATVDGHRGMYWTLGDTKQARDMGSFIVLQIPHTEWNTNATCTVKLNDTYDCSEDLGVKVFKRPEGISVHSDGPAVDGNHLELKCEVSDVAILQNLTVMWYMNGKIMKTDLYYPSTNTTTTTTTNVTSVLMWNVSREHHGATFTCEASESGTHGLLYVSNDTWNLSVQYAPEFEENEYSIRVNDSGDVSLFCEAKGNPPPHYRWTKDGVTVGNNTNYLNISQVKENATFYCVASNDHGSGHKTFIVSAMETTPAPNGTAKPAAPKSSGCPLTVTPENILVKFGNPASANCSTTEGDADGIGWEATTDGIGITPVTHLKWRAKKVQTWTIKAECFINLQNGSHCKKPLIITVWKSPDTVQASPNGTSRMVEGQPHQLKCDISNVAPVEKLQVKWYQDGKLVHKDKYKGSSNESKSTPQNVTSIWEVTPAKEQNGANFTCETELLLEQEQNPKVMSAPYTASVQYKPSILSCPKKDAGREGVFQLGAVACKAEGNPEPDAEWYFKGKLVNSTKPLTRTESGQYTAKFTNVIGDTSATVNITVEYSPSFSCQDHYNITDNFNLGSECKPEGIPKPEITWFKDRRKIALPKIWTRQDSGQYSIEAKNKHGQANHTLSINVLYMPMFTKEATTIEFNLGENVTLECSADGNPSPQLHWKKYPPAANVYVNTRGRYNYVYVVKATSSNAGLYSCTATNEVGSVSKNVTLMIIAGNTRNNNLIIAVAILVPLILIIVCILLCRYCKKKSGHYDVVRPYDSELPLTTMSTM